RRARAARAPVTFLHEEAAAQISERLIEVNKTFTRVAFVGPFAEVWRAALPPGVEVTAVEDAPVLDLEVGAYDLAVHGLALHWADDPVGQLVQLRRALRPDGLLIAVLFGDQTLHELRSALAEAEVALRGGLSPRVAPLGELRDLGGLLQRAGLALPVADGDRLTVTYEGLSGLVRDLRGMGETNVLAARDRRAVPRGYFDRAAQIYAERFPAEGGRIAATFDLVFLTGWAPSVDQPQPLRPGSATIRLADALGTEERPGGDATPRPKPGD
ncbi:MAG: methyltransferase domain-containing protein, partial [Pseudomonadota bacterium]